MTAFQQNKEKELTLNTICLYNNQIIISLPLKLLRQMVVPDMFYQSFSVITGRNKNENRNVYVEAIYRN